MTSKARIARAMSTKHDFDNLARFGITANKASGVSSATSAGMRSGS